MQVYIWLKEYGCTLEFICGYLIYCDFWASYFIRWDEIVIQLNYFLKMTWKCFNVAYFSLSIKLILGLT